MAASQTIQIPAPHRARCTRRRSREGWWSCHDLSNVWPQSTLNLPFQPCFILHGIVKICRVRENRYRQYAISFLLFSRRIALNGISLRQHSLNRFRLCGLPDFQQSPHRFWHSFTHHPSMRGAVFNAHELRQLRSGQAEAITDSTDVAGHRINIPVSVGSTMAPPHAPQTPPIGPRRPSVHPPAIFNAIPLQPHAGSLT